MALPVEIDHVQQGQDRLLQQWKDKPVMSGLIQSFMESIQQTEDMLWQLLTERSIFTAIGEQLNVIGLIVGLDRGAMDDETYRAELLKQIAVNRSDGTTEVIISLMESATQTSNSDFWEHYPASIFYFVRGGYFAKLKEILEAISQAGVRSLLMFDEGDCFIPGEHLVKLEFLIDEFLDKFEITDGNTTGPELWSDPATLSGTGWVDNGSGSYTHSGVVSGEVRSVAGSLVENKSYAVTVTASGGGTFSLQAGGTPTNGFNTASGLTAGTHTIVLAAEDVASINALRIISSSEITVSNISVREALIDYLVVSILATQFLPTSMSYLPEIQEVVNATNLWTDPASTIGDGWVDNGGGNYSHTGNFGSLDYLESGLGSLTPDTLYSVDMEITQVAASGRIHFVAGGEVTHTSFPPATARKNIVSNIEHSNEVGITKRYLFNVRTEPTYAVNSFRIFGQRAMAVENIKIKEVQVINPLCDIVEFTG